MSEPQTLAQLEPAFDRRLWAAVDVLNPGIALIDRGRHLGILLAKDMTVEHNGTMMRGVCWIRLPLGLRRVAHRLFSRMISLRLPHEWLFNEVFLTLAPNGMFIARIGQEPLHPLVLPAPSQVPYPTQALTARRYQQLASSRGRLLESQIHALFHRHLGIDGERATSVLSPGYPTSVLPWKVFAG